METVTKFYTETEYELQLPEIKVRPCPSLPYSRIVVNRWGTSLVVGGSWDREIVVGSWIAVWWFSGVLGCDEVQFFLYLDLQELQLVGTEDLLVGTEGLL